MHIRRRRFLAASVAVPAILAGAGFGAAFAEDGSIGHLSRSAGEVAILRGGQALPGAVNAGIQVTDRIRTGAGGRAEIVFQDGSILTVGAESEVAIASFAPDPAESNAVLELLSGIVRATVNQATGWNRFEIRSSTAVASVRGTDFLVEANADTSAVFVAEGRVAVSSRAGAGTVVIREGQGVDVGANVEPLVVKTWGAKRRDAALARVTFP